MQEKKKDKATPVVEGQKRKWVAPEDRLIEWPDGLRTMKDQFPGLYPELAPERIKARQLAMAPDALQGVVDAATWPIPCPDCLCVRDGSLIAAGIVADPLVKGQAHHWLCQYWDRTGRTPY